MHLPLRYVSNAVDNEYTDSRITQEDEALLLGFVGQHDRFFDAVFVRLCEKRLLKRAIKKAESILNEENSLARAKLKRAHDEHKDSRRAQKKAKR